MRLPIRIQRRSARGWRTPAHAKYVGPGSLLEIANPRGSGEFENPYYRMWDRER